MLGSDVKMPDYTVTWETVKEKLESEGAKNKQYDSDLDGNPDLAASHSSRHIAGGADAIPNGGIARTQLEYPTEDVNFSYLFSIEKVTRFGTVVIGFTDHLCVITTDDFSDKAVRGYALGCARYHGRWSNDDNFYTADTNAGASTADFRLGKRVGGTETILASEAVDLGNDVIYHRALSISGSTLKGFRSDGVADLPATANTSATDTDLTSGGWGVLVNAEAQGDCYGGNELKAWFIAPLSALSPASIILDVEVAVDEAGQNKAKLLQNTKEISSLTGLPDFLYQEVKRYETLRAKGFTDEEIELLLGYIPQHQVDLASVTWGAFDHKPAHATMLITITADNSYQSGAIQTQIDNAKSKNLKVLKPPRDYAEAVEQYKTLKTDFPEWLAGKENFAFQAIGHEDIEPLAVADFYYGELIEHKTHYNQLKKVPDWEMERILNMWKERLERVTAVPTERKELHQKKISEIFKKGW